MKVNLLFGLPVFDSFTCENVLSQFFFLEGLHIVCGGTTAQYVADFLHKSLVLGFHYEDSQIPPIAHIEGVDLVTEGIVTMTAALKKFTNGAVPDDKRDGASLVYNALYGATEINFFVSTVENPANCKFTFLKSKVEIVELLASYLRDLGKSVNVKHI